QSERSNQSVARHLPAPEKFDRYEQEADEGEIHAALSHGVSNRHEGGCGRKQNEPDKPSVGGERKAAAVDPCERSDDQQSGQGEDSAVGHYVTRNSDLRVEVLAHRNEEQPHIVPDNAALGKEILIPL